MIRLIAILITLYSTQALALVNLTNINHSIINYNSYKVTFTLDRQIGFEVLSLESQNRIAIDFYKTNFAIKPNKNSKLNGKFVRSIHKLTKHDSDLRMILELSPNTKLKKHYFAIKDNQLLVTIELQNNLLLEAKPQIKKEYIIVIDPGHGGIDNGTKGTAFNTLEKNLTLSYAKSLYKELSKYPQYKVLMTRDKDQYLSKEARFKKIRNLKADLLISIHADFNQDPSIHGASVYTLSQEAAKEDTLIRIEQKNKNDILKNNNLLEQNKSIANVLIDMVYKDTINTSISLAKYTTSSLNESVNMLPKSHRSAGLKVLKGVDIPAILIEVGYLSNAEEEKLLNSKSYKKKFIYALTQGINKFFAENK